MSTSKTMIIIVLLCVLIMAGMGVALKSSREQVDRLSKAADEYSKQLEDSERQLQGLRLEIRALEASQRAFDGVAKQHQMEAKQAQERIAQLQSEIQALEASQRAIDAAAKQPQKDTDIRHAAIDAEAKEAHDAIAKRLRSLQQQYGTQEEVEGKLKAMPDSEQLGKEEAQKLASIRQQEMHTRARLSVLEAERVRGLADFLKSNSKSLWERHREEEATLRSRQVQLVKDRYSYVADRIRLTKDRQELEKVLRLMQHLAEEEQQIETTRQQYHNELRRPEEGEAMTKEH